MNGRLFIQTSVRMPNMTIKPLVSLAGTLRSIAANCAPVNYEKLHPLIVPESVRRNSKYNGYGFVVPLDDLDEYFIEVDT